MTSTRRQFFFAYHSSVVGSVIVRRWHAFLPATKLAMCCLRSPRWRIHAISTFLAEYICQNLMIQANVINVAHGARVHRLLLLGSSCIYLCISELPMREGALLTGTLESTNEPYAIARIAGIKLRESYNRQYGRD